MARAATFVAILVLALAGSGPVVAQDLPVPEPGVVLEVPIVDDIVVDGDLSDWVAVPLITTTSGPADFAGSGAINWQIAAVGERLVFSALVDDDVIVAGEHGDDYWNEDSVELYVNLSGDPTATTYGPGIGQLTFSPVDIGSADPDALTITGNGAEAFEVTGFVFETSTGWGVEVAVDLTGRLVPADGERFGLQVHANGSNGGDRDTKLIWSLADVDDTSFQDPSVFGTGVFVDQRAAVAEDSVAASDEVEPETETATAENEVIVGDAAGASATDDALAAEPLETESEGNRSVLIAAVTAAFLLVVGAILLERRKSKTWQPE